MLCGACPGFVQAGRGAQLANFRQLFIPIARRRPSQPQLASDKTMLQQCSTHDRYTPNT